MRKVWLIFKREYLVRVRTKGFIVSTIGLPLLSVGVLLFTLLLATRQTNRTLRIAILDDAGGLAPPISAGLKEKLPNGQPLFQVVRILDPSGPTPASRGEFAQDVRQGQLDGYLVIPKDVVSGAAVTFHTKNPGDIGLMNSINRAVNDAVISRRLTERGVKLDNIRDVVRAVPVSLVKVTQTGEAEEKGQTLLMAISAAMVLYITLAVWGLTTLRSVLEEKTSRVVEMLVASARASHLLSGKILGVAAVAFTQYLIWIAAGLLLATYGGTMASALRPGSSVPRLHVPTPIMVYMVLFFLAGYFLYASLYAAAGAMVSSDEEAQQVQLPVTLLIVASMVLYPALLRDPNSTTAVILSMIPFFSPILMVFRIGLQMPPFWQIALSLAILVLTTLAVIKVSAKIYRVGILMYGKRPSLVELLRWLKYT